MKKFFAAVMMGILLGGCLGYHVGPVKPAYLRDVQSIAVPTFRNSTLAPRVEALVTGTVINQFQQDGTYRITSVENADAVLKGDILRIVRAQSRSVQGNVLATQEFILTMSVRYSLVGRDGKTLVPPAEVSGTTSFFIASDVTTEQRQALPLAAEQLAVNLVSQLSEGW